MRFLPFVSVESCGKHFPVHKYGHMDFKLGIHRITSRKRTDIERRRNRSKHTLTVQLQLGTPLFSKSKKMSFFCRLFYEWSYSTRKTMCVKDSIRVESLLKFCFVFLISVNSFSAYQLQVYCSRRKYELVDGIFAEEKQTAFLILNMTAHSL